MQDPTPDIPANIESPAERAALDELPEEGDRR
jgi:hypothetical protein